MSKGGDHRPIIRPEGRDLHYASLLMQALCDDASEAGIPFNQEREALFLRWQRLIRTLSNYALPGWGEPPPTLEHFDKYFDLLESPRDVFYPRPRPLTSEELSQYQFRQQAASEAYDDLYIELHPYKEGTDQASNRIYEEAVSFILGWVNEVCRQANPNVKRRTSKRLMVKRYRHEVEDFCRRWHLDAWWAAPSIHKSHFMRVELDIDAPPLSTYLYMWSEVWPESYQTIVARLPGATDEEFERDCRALSHAMLEDTAQGDRGVINVTRRPKRFEMATLEDERGASCVVIDWDGRDRYKSRYDANVYVTVSKHIIEECEARLDRPLKKREKRELSSQVDDQLTSGRKRYIDAGWEASGHRDVQTQARWVAQRLLDPSRSWAKITGADPNELEIYSRMRACHTFAEKASLTLPTRN